MVNVIPPNHVDDVHVVELDQHDDVLAVLEPVLVDKEEDLEKDKFEEVKDPQEEEDDMEVEIEEDENEPELTYPSKEMDPLNPLPPASESEPEDAIEAENPIEHEDETIPASVHEVGESSTAPLLRKDNDGLLVGLMRRDINSLFGNEVRFSMEQGTAAMEKLVEKLGNAEDKVECKKLKKELEEARIMPPKSPPLSQAAIHQMIKDNVDAAIAIERARQANFRNDASGSGPARGQDATLAARECTFTRFMKCNPTAFRGIEGAVELLRWFEKTESVFGINECAEGKKVRFVVATLQGPTLSWWNAKIYPIEHIQRMEHELWNLKVKEYNIVAYTQRFDELVLMCPRMVEPERVKVDAYILGLTDNIKGEVTFSRPTNLSEAVCMAHKLMDQKAQARDERILEGKKQKWESFQSGNSSGKGNQRDNSHQTLQNNQRQGNARAMVTASTDGKLPLCERCFSRHVGQCTIKCHKCGKVRHKSRHCKEKNVATGVNVLPIPTCYDCGEQGHTRNRCPKKVKQEEVREVRTRAYAIKDAEPKGLNVVTGIFLLNNRYAFILFDSGFDRSFVDTRFSYTVNLVNHVFEIDLMPIELGTFDIIIGMDWLAKHDAVIVFCERFVRIPYGNKMLIVESDKGVSRLKVISCVKARYHQLRIKEEDIPITAFRTWYGDFEFQVMMFGLTNALAMFMDLMNRVCEPYLDKFIIVFMDYILVYSKDEEEHEKYLKIILELLKKERFGVHVDPAKVETIKSWTAPMKPTKVRQFLGLDGYYRRFIEALPEGTKDFVAYCDVSLKGYGAVLMQREKIIETLFIWNEVCGFHRLQKPTIYFESERVEFEQRRWIELLSDYDCEIRYHPGKANVVANALSRNERDKPLRRIGNEFGYEYRLPPLNGWSKQEDYTNAERYVACLHQKSYADKRAKPLEFEFGDMVLLKISPWKGVVCFGKHEKLSPCYIGPFKILARVGPVAYTLELPEELEGIHSMFHVSNLMKCLVEGDVVIPVDEIQLDDKLRMIEEPVEVVDREVKRLRKSRIPIVKVCWNSQRGPKYTWECEEQIKKRYPHLFTSKDEARKVDKSSGAPRRCSLKEGRM
nr:hypothetical protein [Tanacetum cinerariifolium]